MAGKGRPPTQAELQSLAQRVRPPNEAAKTLQEHINASKSQQVKGVDHIPSGTNVSPSPAYGNRGQPQQSAYLSRERVLERQNAIGRPPAGYSRSPSTYTPPDTPPPKTPSPAAARPQAYQHAEVVARNTQYQQQLQAANGKDALARDGRDQSRQTAQQSSRTQAQTKDRGNER